MINPAAIQFVFLVVTWGFIVAFALCGLVALVRSWKQWIG